MQFYSGENILRFFLIAFFLTYGTFHAYAFFRLKAAVPLTVSSGLPVAIFMLLMTVAPLLVYFTERLGMELTARFLSYTGYLWMGFLFLFVSAALVLDLLRLVMYLGALLVNTHLAVLIPSAQLSFFLPLLFALSVVVFGYFEARDVHLERITVTSPKIPQSAGRLRIAQISDVHLGLIVRQERLKKILEAVREADPDIIVSIGDLVDGQINKLDGLADLLGALQPRYGKYAITGNHEFYAGFHQAEEFTRKAGFTLLRGEAAEPGGVIAVAGVDDPAGKIYNLYANIAERQLLAGLDHDKFVLFLKHRPLISKDISGLFDLQLSGHTHKGQIFPFSLLTHYYYPTDSGLASLPGGALLYVSRGSGTWGPPVRFLSPPEVTLIELVHSDS